MINRSKIGNMSTNMKIELYEIVTAPTLTYNMEAWAKLSKTEEKMLEKIQGDILKRILKLPKSTPYKGLLYETGVWPIKEKILYKKLMLYQNIMKSDDNRVIKKILAEQIKRPTPNCWYQNLQEDVKKYSIDIDALKVTRQSKSELKKEVKEKIHNILEKEFRQNKSKKLRTVIKNEYKRKSYITTGNFTEDEIKQIMKIRLHMIEIKGNYPSGDRTCQWCNSNEESTEHVLIECSKLDFIRKEKVEERQLHSEEESDIKAVLQVNQMVQKIMRSTLEDDIEE